MGSPRFHIGLARPEGYDLSFVADAIDGKTSDSDETWTPDLTCFTWGVSDRDIGTARIGVGALGNESEFLCLT
jgi:hypothetical protein